MANPVSTPVNNTSQPPSHKTKTSAKEEGFKEKPKEEAKDRQRPPPSKFFFWKDSRNCSMDFFPGWRNRISPVCSSKSVYHPKGTTTLKMAVDFPGFSFKKFDFEKMTRSGWVGKTKVADVFLGGWFTNLVKSNSYILQILLVPWSKLPILGTVIRVIPHDGNTSNGVL